MPAARAFFQVRAGGAGVELVAADAMEGRLPALALEAGMIAAVVVKKAARTRQ